MSQTAIIPLIDFTKCGLQVEDDAVKDSDLFEAGVQLYDAFRNSGFAYLSNSGISRKQIEEIENVCEKFFSLPIEEKKQYCSETADLGGYDPIGVLRTNKKRGVDYLEAFRMSGPRLEDENCLWPDIPDFKEKQEQFLTDGKRLVQRLFRALGLGMKLKDPDYFCKNHKLMNKKGNSTQSKMAKYPPILSNDTLEKNQIRIGEHTDFGSLTVLFQDDVGGLQIETEDGSFIDVHPIPETAVLNIGDMLQFWSGNRLKATVHRVIPPEDPVRKLRTRRIVGYFALADDNALLDELEFKDARDKANKEKRPVITASEHIAKRFALYFDGY